MMGGAIGETWQRSIDHESKTLLIGLAIQWEACDICESFNLPLTIPSFLITAFVTLDQWQLVTALNNN